MAEQGTAARLIEVATAEIGTIEGPKDNQTKYGAFTKVNFQPWCGSFVMWCGNEAGVKIPNTVSTVAGADAYRKQKRWYDNDGTNIPEPGDIIYFDFPSDGVDRISHVGIVAKVDAKSGICTTIEGNTAGNPKGDQRNGGMCVEKTRAYVKDNKLKLINAVVGWGRPVYSGEENTPLLSKVGSSDSPVKSAKPAPAKAATPVVKAAKAAVKVEAAPAEVVTPIVETPSEATKEA